MAIIVITDKPGQLGNQLWSYLNLIAHAISSKKKVIVTLEDVGFDFFDKPVLPGIILINRKFMFFGLWTFFIRFVKYQHKKPLINKMFQLFKFSVANNFFTIQDLEVSIQKNGVLFIESWPNRVHKNIPLMQQQKIKRFFTFRQSLTYKVDEIIETKKKGFDLMVGIHIRRGDYKNFMGGTYYFENETYSIYMQQMKYLFPEKKILFLISSNEPIDKNTFAGNNYFQIDNATSGVDMYALSCCEYIIGPMSTFSMWAAYYGSKPIFFIKSKSEMLQRGTNRDSANIGDHCLGCNLKIDHLNINFGHSSAISISPYFIRDK